MEYHVVGFIFIFAVLFSIVNATTPCDFPAIFNFGDSNSDTGGFSAAFGQAPPPNGESYFGGPAGRVSDGRLVIDFIAESLGLPYLNHFLDSLRPNYTHGANFAYSGATIRNYYEFVSVIPFSLQLQFNQFDQFHRRSKKLHNQEIYRGLLPKPEEFSRALYTLDIAQNDMYSIFTTSKNDTATTVKDMLDQFKKVVGHICDAGGRSFWIHNSGPLGCLPAIVEGWTNTSSQFDEAGCSVHHNELVKYFNSQLKEAVVQLRKDFPFAVFTYVDIYTVKYTLISQAKKHGFEDPLQVCCGYGGKHNFDMNRYCGYNATENGIHVYAGKCKDPSVRINWDGSHYTQAANKFVFDQIVNGCFSDPPIPIKMACHKQY